MKHAPDPLELVGALQIAPRASWRQLSQVLGASPLMLAQQWQRLTDRGLAWCTAVPFGRNRPGTLTFVAVRCLPEHRDRLTEEAIAIPEIVSIEEPARHWDLIFTVLTPDFESYLESLNERISKLPGITRYETIICTRVHFDGHEWRLGSLDHSARQQLVQFARTDTSATPPPLRDGDRELTPYLHRDGRATVADIAESLGTHPSTISRRMQRLLLSGKVTLRCDLAPELLGQPISSQWFCWLSPEQHTAAAAALRSFPNLRFCASTTGETNFTFVLWVRTPEEIFEAERRLIEHIPGFSIAESSITVRFIKRMGWRLDERGRRTGEPVSPVFVG